MRLSLNGIKKQLSFFNTVIFYFIIVLSLGCDKANVLSFPYLAKNVNSICLLFFCYKKNSVFRHQNIFFFAFIRWIFSNPKYGNFPLIFFSHKIRKTTKCLQFSNRKRYVALKKFNKSACINMEVREV